MSDTETGLRLERKFCRFDEDIQVTDGSRIEGFASVFGVQDQSGDVVVAGAYSKCLERMAGANRAVKLLWQHDPAQPIGIWDEVREEANGLYVRGRLLTDVEKGREAACLIEAGALDGLSIGYRTVKAQRDGEGRRLLTELDLWEVSVVTFPMLPDARIGGKSDTPDDSFLKDLADALHSARDGLRPMTKTSDFHNQGAGNDPT